MVHASFGGGHIKIVRVLIPTTGETAASSVDGPLGAERGPSLLFGLRTLWPFPAGLRDPLQQAAPNGGINHERATRGPIG